VHESPNKNAVECQSGVFARNSKSPSQSFYVWRKRLRQPEAVRFALVERGAAPAAIAAEPMLELALKTGERLRIRRGVDEATLRTVLATLRA